MGFFCWYLIFRQNPNHAHPIHAIILWLLAEIVLGFVNLDRIADYVEFIEQQRAIAAQIENL